MKKVIVSILFIGVLGLLLACFVVFSIVNQMDESEKKRKDFIALLDKSNYSFVGEVMLTEKSYKGVGFLCLKKLEFDEMGVKKLVFNGHIVSMANDKGYIVQLDQISFTSEDNEQLKVQVGDIVRYNVNSSGLYQVFRKDTLIYQDHAIIDNPTLQERFLEFSRNSCK